MLPRCQTNNVATLPRCHNLPQRCHLTIPNALARNLGEFTGGGGGGGASHTGGRLPCEGVTHAWTIVVRAEVTPSQGSPTRPGTPQAP